MKRKIFYGWYIVAACVVVAAAGIGFHNTASIFIRPVTEDLGFSRGEFTFFRTIVVILAAVLLPSYAKLVRKFSIKKVMLVGTSLNSLALFSYSFGTEIWHFYLIAVFNGLVVNASHFMVIGILISRWFEDKKGLALGLAFAGSGLGAAIMVPLASWIIEVFGWRWGFRFSGMAALCILVPTVLLLIKDNPEALGLSPYRRENGDSASSAGMVSEPKGLYLAEARKTPCFWLLAVALLGISISASAPNAHTAPYLSDLGYSVRVVSAVVSLSMIVLTVGKIIMGHVFDRFGTFVGGITLGVFCILSPAFALWAVNPVAPWMHAVFLGMASTGFSIPVNIYAMKFFGQKDFPAILSVLSVVTALGAAFSPPGMGLVYDFFGSYTYAWVALILIGCVVTLCLTGADMVYRKLSIEKRFN